MKINKLAHSKNRRDAPGPVCAAALVARYIPEGPDRDYLARLVVVGEKFLGQQVGRRQGLLYRLVEDCARKAGPPYCFESLIWELELMAARRTLNGSEASPVEKVDRIWQLLTIHDKGRKQVAFGTLRNHLTTAKKNLLNEIHGIR